MRSSDFPFLYQIPDLLEIMVKPSVKPYLQLHAVFVHGIKGLIYTVNAEINGLFAEDVLACIGSLYYYLRMGIRGRADQNRFNFRISNYSAVVIVNIINSKFIGPFFHIFCIYVGNCLNLCSPDVIDNVFSMKPAYPSCAYYTRFNLSIHIPFLHIRLIIFLFFP